MKNIKKRYGIFLIMCMLLFLITGCGKEEEPSLVEGKYYITSPYVLRFEDDNTVTIVEYTLKKVGEVSSVRTHYAIYSCDEKAITITVSDKEYVGVIIENGERIAFGDDRLNIADINNCSDKVRNAFGVE